MNLTIAAHLGVVTGVGIAGWLALIAHDVGSDYRRFDGIAARREARAEARAMVAPTDRPRHRVGSATGPDGAGRSAVVPGRDPTRRS